jgi:hypothetical protein
MTFIQKLRLTASESGDGIFYTTSPSVAKWAAENGAEVTTKPREDALKVSYYITIN